MRAMDRQGARRRNRDRAATMAAAIMATLATGAFAALAQAAVLIGEAQVEDGDTLKLGVVPVRIHGIDAPEDGQRCELPAGGRWSCDDAARDRLAELVEGREIRCEVQAVDPYGRLVSICLGLGGADVGRTLVDEGLAWAYTEYADDYAELELEARAAGLGLWRDGADPQTPWDYRANKWERAAAASPRRGCPIKGNIGGDGEKIYHTPWSKYYSRTWIDESNGEKWFCDEAEAAAAGWRPARSR